MKVMKMSVLLVAVMAAIFPARSQALIPVEPAYENTIQVTGTAEREILPDEIFVRIVISENDTKGKVSVDKMEQDMITALRNIGVDVENNLKVGDMSSSLHEKIFGKNTTRTTATYQLKISSAEMLGNVYQRLGSFGISNITITALNHSRIREITAEVRIEAVKNAQQMASDMARALGQEIGKAVYVVDYNNQVINTRSNYKADLIMEADSYDTGAGAAALDFRNIKLSYSVSVKFALL